MLNTYQEKKSLNISEIVAYYKNSIKRNDQFYIGVEWEKQSLDKSTLKNADYKILQNIIEDFALINSWGILKDKGVIIGSFDGKNSISLEPGGQLELSLEPKEKIDDIKKISEKIWKLLDKIGAKYNVVFAPIGITPKSTFNDIKILPKERYLIMRDYFEGIEEKLSHVMMRETASIQINVDYSSEEDCFNKLKAVTYILPFITGFFGNSYIRENKINGYKSYRANAWLDTDKNRCGVFYRNIFKKPSPTFEDYIESIIKIPMLYIERNNKKITINGEINFKDFMEEGYMGYYPTLNDYILHSSLTFPNVRIKNYLEIRNHDSQKEDMMLTICALYKGLLSKRETVNKILKDFKLSLEELEELNINCAKFGLSFKYKGELAYKIAEKIFKLSFDNLDNQEDKIKLLKPLKMLSNNQSLSDVMIKDEINNAQKIIDFSLS